MVVSVAKRVLLILIILLMLFMVCFLGYYQIKLIKADKEIHNLEEQFNELNAEYEKLHQEIENELLNGVE